MFSRERERRLKRDYNIEKDVAADDLTLNRLLDLAALAGHATKLKTEIGDLFAGTETSVTDDEVSRLERAVDVQPKPATAVIERPEIWGSW